MELTDKAFNTLTVLRNETWLEGDLDIKTACKELVAYLEQV